MGCGWVGLGGGGGDLAPAYLLGILRSRGSPYAPCLAAAVTWAGFPRSNPPLRCAVSAMPDLRLRRARDAGFFPDFTGPVQVAAAVPLIESAPREDRRRRVTHLAESCFPLSRIHRLRRRNRIFVGMRSVLDPIDVIWPPDIAQESCRRPSAQGEVAISAPS